MEAVDIPPDAAMLDFAARHKITAKTESAPLEEAQAAVQKVRTGEARYRIVLNI